ncbi:MAG: hypothetical protein K0S09_391 [Sphingobacteriaceae bacterium]|nr:hypothetical protein [Sphingobacteriaceae bacterium]
MLVRLFCSLFLVALVLRAKTSQSQTKILIRVSPSMERGCTFEINQDKELEVMFHESGITMYQMRNKKKHQKLQSQDLRDTSVFSNKTALYMKCQELIVNLPTLLNYKDTRSILDGLDASFTVSTGATSHMFSIQIPRVAGNVAAYDLLQNLLVQTYLSSTKAEVRTYAFNILTGYFGYK